MGGPACDLIVYHLVIFSTLQELLEERRASACQHMSRLPVARVAVIFLLPIDRDVLVDDKGPDLVPDEEAFMFSEEESGLDYIHHLVPNEANNVELMRHSLLGYLDQSPSVGALPSAEVIGDPEPWRPSS